MSDTILNLDPSQYFYFFWFIYFWSVVIQVLVTTATHFTKTCSPQGCKLSGIYRNSGISPCFFQCGVPDFKKNKTQPSWVVFTTLIMSPSTLKIHLKSVIFHKSCWNLCIHDTFPWFCLFTNLMSDFAVGKICQKISGIFLKNHLHPWPQVVSGIKKSKEKTTLYIVHSKGKLVISKIEYMYSTTCMYTLVGK
jgi:hypothetical protein